MSKVLVAEDDRTTRLMVNRALEKEGYDVIEARDGGAACKTAMAERPDVILLDLKMPVMDGFDVLRKLRQNPDTEETPVIVLTAVPPEEGEPIGAKLGVRNYITKPLDLGTVKLAVKGALRELARRAPRLTRTRRVVSQIVDTLEPMAGETQVLRDTLSIGDDMLDQKMGGGIRISSLGMIEGEPSAGKSILCQHFAYSSVRSGYPVAYVTFEDTSAGLLAQMASLGLDVTVEAKRGLMRVYPLTYPEQPEDTDTLLTALGQKIAKLPSRFKTVIVDPLTSVGSGCSDRAVMGFFSQCKRQTMAGRTIVLAFHTFTFDEKMMIRISALCDAFLRLSVEHIAMRLVKTLEVCKVHNAVLDTSNTIRFEVLAGKGMQISPFRRVNI